MSTAAHNDAQGNEPACAISAVDAIMFSLTVDDHYDRLNWLKLWVHGEWGTMRREWPEFSTNEWRKP